MFAPGTRTWQDWVVVGSSGILPRPLGRIEHFVEQHRRRWGTPHRTDNQTINNFARQFLVLAHLHIFYRRFPAGFSLHNSQHFALLQTKIFSLFWKIFWSGVFEVRTNIKQIIFLPQNLILGSRSDKSFHHSRKKFSTLKVSTFAFLTSRSAVVRVFPVCAETPMVPSPSATVTLVVWILNQF